VFDVGFWELTLIATLALLVLGPDKLPAVVNSVGRMLGRARSLARGLKMQIEREMNQAATVTPKPKPRPGPASTGSNPTAKPGGAGEQPPDREATVPSTADEPRKEPKTTAGDPHGESRPAE